MTRYAEKTSVSVERSEAELKGILRRYDAARIVTGFDDRQGVAVVSFEIEGRIVRLQVRVPFLVDLRKAAESDPPHGWKSWTPAKRDAWLMKERLQIERARWRALVLIVKAKLETVAEGLSTFEREFLADLVLPSGRTVHEEVGPKVLDAYENGKMPKLLLGGLG